MQSMHCQVTGSMFISIVQQSFCGVEVSQKDCHLTLIHHSLVLKQRYRAGLCFSRYISTVISKTVKRFSKLNKMFFGIL